MKYNRALEALGLAVSASVTEAHRTWRVEMKAARTRGDTVRAVVLSEVNEAIKVRARRYRHCKICNEPTGSAVSLCQVHRHAMKIEPGEHMIKIERGVVVPPASREVVSPLRLGIRLLKAGNVGDSFTAFMRTNSHAAAIAKKEKVQVLIRRVFPVVISPKHNKHKLHRIWRSDGLSAEELNACMAAQS